jgi:hypothetical protein
MSLTRMAAMVGGAMIVLTSAVSAQSEAERQVLNRATLWVHQFVDAYTNVVAEEVYLQETTSPRRQRRLRSDYSLVRFPGATEWHAFRDVLEVDGKPVPDVRRTESLARLFLEPPANARRRVEEIARTSSRYNIADIGTLNEPLRVLAYLQEGYRQDFRFTFAGIDEDLGPTVRTVRFEEVASPTILRGARGADVRSFGLLSIDEPTGRIVRTELRPGRFTPATTRIVTTFRFDTELGIDVPATMEDLYPDRTGEIRGKATYGNFRRFQARAQEAIDVPPAPR